MSKQNASSSVRRPMSLGMRLLLVALCVVLGVAAALLAYPVVARMVRVGTAEEQLPAAAPDKGTGTPSAQTPQRVAQDASRAPAAAGDEELRSLLAQGRQAAAEGTYVVAIGFFRKACEHASDSKEAWLALVDAYRVTNDYTAAWKACERGLSCVGQEDRRDLGMALARLAWSCGKADVAIKETERILGLKPNDVPAHILAADALLAGDRADDALVHARKAVELDPENLDAQLSLGCALAGVGLKNEAQAVLTRYLGKVPDSVRGRVAMVRVQRLLGETAKAQQTLADIGELPADKETRVIEVPLDKAGELPPGTVTGDSVLKAKAAAERAELLLQQGKREDALAAYQKLAEEHPDLDSVQYRLAELMLLMGKREEARKLAEAQLAKSSKNPGAHSILARAYLAGQMPGMAVDECRKALALIDGGDTAATVTARKTLAVALARSDKEEEAAKEMQLYLDRRPDDRDAIFRLSSYLMSLDRVDAAESLLRGAIERFPDAALLHTQMGKLLATRGKNEEALAYLRKAIELGDKRLLSHLALVEVLIRTGHLAEATEKATRMRQAMPRQHLVADTLASCLISQNKYDEAVPHIEYAIKAVPAAPRYRYHHALLLEGQGDAKEAVAELREALKSPRKWGEREAARALVAKLSQQLQ